MFVTSDQRTISLAKSEAPYETRQYYRHRPVQNDINESYLKLITSNTYKPLFTQRLRPRVIQESNNVKLTCTVDGRPTPSVSWFKGRTQITGSTTRYTTRYQHGMCTLEINNCVTADSGDYICKATNNIGSDETSALIFVESTRKSKPEVVLQESQGTIERNEPTRQSVDQSNQRQRVKREIVFEPQIIEDLQALTVYEGTSALLQCRIEGKPFPDISWFKNGELLDIVDNVIASVSDNQAKLTIKKVTKMDAGEYECKISNKAGEVSSRADLVVKDGVQLEQPEEIEEAVQGEVITEHPTEVMTESQTEEALIIGSSPYFTKQLESMNVNEAEEMLLGCKVESSEEYSFEWLRNNQVIPDNPDFIRQNENGFHSLLVHEMFPEDSGIFGLRATNSSGTRTSLCTVIVHEENSEKLFEIIDFPTSTNVRAGQTIHLECVVKGSENEMNGVWFVNDVQIVDDTVGFRTEKVEKGTGATRLAIFIDEANEAIHEGPYRLEISKGDRKLVVCASVHVQ
ncbi:hypothetical protein ACOME3_009125 [Neoechinorhynchus agilis]